MKRLGILCSLLLVTMIVTAQDTTISPELTDELDSLEATVENIRELEALNPVIRRFPTADEVAAFIEESYNQELTDDIIFEETMFYRGFGFVEPEFDLRTVYINLLKDQVAGYYDSETKEMNTILISGEVPEDSLPIFERIIYAHEFTHALQDQHFDLTTYLDETVTEPDQVLAMLALVEGDATLVMQEYLTALAEENPLVLLGVLSLSLTGVGEIPPGTPAIMESELTMPYLDGMNLVMAVRRIGGWQAVNVMFDNPPISTEQVLHPEKYMALEQPVEITLNPVTLDGGWQPVLERRLGEFYLREFLATRLAARDAADAAAGWGGDRYQLFYNQNADEVAWVMRLVWDTPEEVAEFNTAWSTFAGGSATTYADMVCWEGETVFCQREDVLAFAPDTALAQQLIQSQ